MSVSVIAAYYNLHKRQPSRYGCRNVKTPEDYKALARTLLSTARVKFVFFCDPENVEYFCSVMEDLECTFDRNDPTLFHREDGEGGPRS